MPLTLIAHLQIWKEYKCFVINGLRWIISTRVTSFNANSLLSIIGFIFFTEMDVLCSSLYSDLDFSSTLFADDFKHCSCTENDGSQYFMTKVNYTDKYWNKLDRYWLQYSFPPCHKFYKNNFATFVNNHHQHCIQNNFWKTNI